MAAGNSAATRFEKTDRGLKTPRHIAARFGVFNNAIAANQRKLISLNSGVR